jgi:hypothetical protein
MQLRANQVAGNYEISKESAIRTDALSRVGIARGLKPILPTGGQEGSRRQVGWTGWVACPGSSRNRRPRSAAPNPYCDAKEYALLGQWLERLTFYSTGVLVPSTPVWRQVRRLWALARASSASVEDPL